MPLNLNGMELPPSATANVQVVDFDGVIQNVPLLRDAEGNLRASWSVPPGPAGTQLSVLLVIQGPSGTTVTKIGMLTRYDPSGFVADAASGCRLAGATVTLERLVAGAWVAVNGEDVVNGKTVIDPPVNPERTDGDGSYGWDVAEGQWRVRVARAGYAPQTSRSVAVPPAVTDLNVFLTPTGASDRSCVKGALRPPSTGSEGSAAGSAADGPAEAVLVVLAVSLLLIPRRVVHRAGSPTWRN